MACATHPDRAHRAECTRCSRALCEACLFYANSAPYCEGCVSVLQREYLAERQSRPRRFIAALSAGIALSAGGVALWEWGMNQTRFGMAQLTPFVMIGVIFGAALLMRRLFREGNKALFCVAALLALGVMLRGEHIIHEALLYRAADQGLSAGQLLRYAEQHTYWEHLGKLGPFDYLYMAAGVFLTWRRLWPMRSTRLDIIRPASPE